jgi:mono/diheme cytochrome c family protein
MPRLAWSILLITLACATPALAAEESGQSIYRDQCARCHGDQGEGSKKTTKPLAGDKSPSQLAALIRRTMPDDDPGSCTDDECRKIVSYIYDRFYSVDAQARLHPPRITLSHLTVGQYRSSAADLIGSFRPPAAKGDSRHGLRGQYYNARDTRDDKRLLDRIDPQVNFDFGTVGPSLGDGDDGDETPSQKFDPNTFTIRWEGSVFAAETGEYEFIVHTEHALRLWVNDLRKPVIDAMVKSGDDVEYRIPMFLIAGRAVSIRLDISKGRELKDKDKNKKNPGPPKPTRASVALLWKVPHHPADEIIPARCLSPVTSPEVAVIRTPFPPDDRSYGWERGTSVSKEWLAATTDAAMDVAGYVVAHLPELSGADDDAKDREPKLKAFCRAFAERAFRRPLTEAEARQLVDHQFQAASDLEVAVKRSIIRVMISPQFLYPGEGTGQYAVAARLALALWDSLPDKELLTAAAHGKLATREQIAQQARRMLDDPRAKLKVRQFLLAWLRVDQSPEIVKDPKKFPDFDAKLASDLRTSLELFLDDIIASNKADFRQLLLSDAVFLNGRLAHFYGVADLAADAPFTKMSREPRTAGVLTQPYMLAAFAYPGESSPIHRGVFIVRGILGITLRPPANSSFTPLPPEQHPDLTTRERITLQTSQDACVACHAVVNQLGFPLEQFDAVGRHRDTEKGKPIDVSGDYETRSGQVAKFSGPRELAAFLAGSDEAHDAFAGQMFQQLARQPVRAYGLDKPKALRQSFAENGYNLRTLLVEVATTASQPP